MGESGNPAKKAATKKTAAKKTSAKKTVQAPTGPSDVSAFKKRKQGILLPLPSGLVVTAKRVELGALVAEGELPNPLMEVVSEAINKGKKVQIADMVGVEDQEIDLDAVRDMYSMVNAVVISSVLTPKVYDKPDDENDRDDALLYVDEVDDEDKMFIFQWASGGTSDLERFREQSATDMATLAEVQGSRGKAK